MESIETVPLAAFEAQAERSTRIIAHMAIGWCISVVMMSVVLMFAISYETETVEEVTTTETTQHADNDGANYYAGGDIGDVSNADGEGYENNEEDYN